MHRNAVITGRIVLALFGLLLFATACGLTIPGAAPSGTLAKIKDRKRILIAAPLAEPFTIQKPDQSYEGLDIDLTQLLGKKLGVTVEYVPATFQNVVAGIDAAKWDMIPALCITPARQEVIDYSDTTVTVGEVWAVRADSAYKSIEDLNKPSVTIPVSTGALSETVTKKFMPNANIVSIPGLNPAQSLQELLSKRADAISTEVPFYTTLYDKQYPGQFRFIPSDKEGVQSCPVAWGIKKGDKEWQTYLNSFLDELRNNGQFSQLVQKWSATEYLKRQ